MDVSIGVRTIANLQVADNIDALAEEEQGEEALLKSFFKPCTKNTTKLSAEKTQLMINSTNDTQRATKVKGQKLGTVTS